jgi:UDP-N-acetylglucosamine 2-epimerase (non-hydrolysing)
MRIACVIGTRPEAVKMAPVVWALQSDASVELSLISTAQHRDLLDPLLRFFDLRPDLVLDVMVPGQSLAELTGRLLTKIAAALAAGGWDLVVAQGDTTTVLATAIACFYAGIPFGHVEAGLRSDNLQHPFPEEFNRIVAGRLASLNFAPTPRARDNLLREGVDPRTIFVTGNPVIDALRWAAERAPDLPIALGPGQRLMLVTLHRRESFGPPLRDVFAALRRLIERNRELVVLYPVHPNPEVVRPASDTLQGNERIILCPPLDYPEFVAAMRAAYLILTDSGGIQEEGPALAKPVLVARETTERPEGIAAGVTRLVGTDAARICAEVQTLLDDDDAYRRMARAVSPYGDGHAGGRIAQAIAGFARRRSGTADRAGRG